MSRRGACAVHPVLVSWFPPLDDNARPEGRPWGAVPIAARNPVEQGGNDAAGDRVENGRSMTRGIMWLYIAGSALSLLTVAVFVAFCWHSAAVSDRLFSLDANAIIGIEFLLLVLATAAIMIAEFSHKASSAVVPDGGIYGRGANHVDVPRRSYLERVLWMLVPITAWAAIFLTPLLITNADQVWDWNAYQPATYAEIVVIGNAFTAAGCFGAMLFSLVKAIGYDAADRMGLTPRRTLVTKPGKKGRKARRKVVTQWPSPQRYSGLWTFVSYMWRLDLIFGFIAVGFVGTLPYTLVHGEGYPSSDLWAPIAAAIIGVAGLAIATNSWRSGEPLTAGESLTTGVL